jgi:hypothetical protein
MTSPGRRRIFDTDKRIRLGLWGLGRGMSFYKTCESLNIDVVAGCDYNEHMRKRFQDACPGALVTADEKEFLSGDFDAVLLATYCVNHGPDSLKVLRAGKHLLSEVTSFLTMAEGVELVEAVEKSALVYNLAENYPWSPQNMWLARKWREGLFGELMYAEFEYVHECRLLCYMYIDGVPVRPGRCVHQWRSWLNFHYYNTHSLGPMMVITGTRPTRVVALPGSRHLAGYPVLRDGVGGIAPSLINMSNGAVVRNLMGATTNDSHVQRIWGTLGSAEINVGKSLQVRLGASGASPKLEVSPSPDDMSQLAAQTGHGGGDFWVLYYFARQILTGEPAPFDIYAAADCTIPGILAARSAIENGRAYDVPDFRLKAHRDLWREDHWRQAAYPQDAALPPGADPRLADQFATTITDLIRYATDCLACADWSRLADEITDPQPLLEVFDRVIADEKPRRKTYRAARKIIDAYPESDAARVLREMLVDIGEEKGTLSRRFLPDLRRRRTALKRKLVRPRRPKPKT